MLRTRLFLYLVPLVAILLAFGVYAAVLVGELASFGQALIANQNAAQAAQQLNAATHDVTLLLIAGLVVAFGAAAYACYKVGQSFIKPIQVLTQATRELVQGNQAANLPVSRDELGELASAFNKMAAQLRDYRHSTAGKIVHLHQTIEATLASFPDPIFLLDDQGLVNLMNPAAEGLSAKLRLRSHLPAPLEEPVRRALDEGKSFLPHDFNETIPLRLSGRARYFLPRIVLMHTDANALLGVAVVLYDMTRFRLMDDLKTNLLATVSHELNTPLTGVRMALHLLMEKSVGPLTPKQLDLVSTARDDAERLLQVLDELLDFMKLQKTGRAQWSDTTVVPTAAASPKETLS